MKSGDNVGHIIYQCAEADNFYFEDGDALIVSHKIVSKVFNPPKRERTVAQTPVPSPRSIQVVRRLPADHLLPHIEVKPEILNIADIVVADAAFAVVVINPRPP